MKRFGFVMAAIAVVFITLTTVGMSANARQDPGHMSTPAGTPDASPMAGQGDHTASTSTGAFYLTIANNGDETDRLISITTDAAERVEIHNVEMDGNVMHMFPQHDGVELPSGERVSLEPGGLHVMMLGLTESLIAGEEFTATLVFEHAGEVEITVPILRTEPDEDELTAEPVEAGDLVIEGIWARQAPKLSDATPMGTPQNS